MPLSNCTGDGGGDRGNLQGSDASTATAGSPGACEGPACSQKEKRMRQEPSFWVFLLPGCSSSTKTLPTASDRGPTHTSFTKTSLNGSDKNRNVIRLIKSRLVVDQLDPECQNSFTSLSLPSLPSSYPDSPPPFLTLCFRQALSEGGNYSFWQLQAYVFLSFSI